jgi:copper(I)-binding protein
MQNRAWRLVPLRERKSVSQDIIMNRFQAAALLAVWSLLLLPFPPANAHDYRVGDLQIAHPWSRGTPPGARVGAGYLRIDNRGTADDRLLSVTMERSGRAEIHEMSVTDGVMRMRELPTGIAIPTGGVVELKPGGLHLMFMELTASLKQGERLDGTLTFERAGKVDVSFAVEAIGASPPASAHAH